MYAFVHGVKHHYFGISQRNNVWGCIFIYLPFHPAPLDSLCTPTTFPTTYEVVDLEHRLTYVRAVKTGCERRFGGDLRNKSVGSVRKGAQFITVCLWNKLLCHLWCVNSVVFSSMTAYQVDEEGTTWVILMLKGNTMQRCSLKNSPGSRHKKEVK